MSRLFLRLTLFLLLIFTAALLLIHAQPYNDHELRAVLLPEGCPAPCFMGIRPGVTTVDEAMKLLAANGWVDQINNQSSYISWKWRDQKPPWISQNEQGEIRLTDQRVSTITIYTDLPLGNTRLAFGLPDVEMVDPEKDQNNPISLYMAFYNQKGLLFENWQPCNVTEPLRTTVMIKMSEASTTKAFSKPINSLTDLFRAC
ncbi:MAG: hypothetical protein ABI970_22685 [Chloroflexota bacterium]